MKLASLKPARHLYVCTNTRADGDPLGEGCGARGEAVFVALKREVARRGATASTWVAKTSCLGLCPRKGCTVGLSPGPRYLVEVEPSDAEVLLDALSS